MAILRSLVTLALVAGFAVFGFTVPIGRFTLFGHLDRIWQTPEAQELVRSLRDDSGPAIERATRGLRAGWEEASKPNPQQSIPAQAVSLNP